MGRASLTRKSVSFEKKETPIEPVEPRSSQEAIKGFPTLSSPLLTVPFHLLVVLAGMFHYGLTSNITDVMFKGLLTLIPVQMAYNYSLILNVVPPSKKKKRSDDNVPLLIGGSILTSFILTVPVFVVLVLFGAPIATDVTQTLLLAAHLSLVIISPLLVAIKFDFDLLAGVVKIDKIYRLIFTNPVLASTFVAILGTWVGVLPIPLDWDRPWQQWPLTLLVGGYAGAVAGGLLGCFV